MTSARTLGIDLGPNSIGWAIIDEGQHRIIDCGVRIFPEGVDNFDTKKEKPRNEARGVARGMRRQIRRRAVRRRRLTQALVTVGLLPASSDERTELFKINPYQLRARALDNPLSRHELGRVFCHFAQRRGFLSNRKRERTHKEVKGILAEMSVLDADIRECGCRTLGEYLYRKGESLRHNARVMNDHVRNRHTRRQMLYEEFDAIWRKQAEYDPDLLTDRLRYGTTGRQQQPSRPAPCPGRNPNFLEQFGIEGLIFFQRPMYWPRSVVGQCELEPKQKRCPRADRRAQRFRMLQEINNLKYSDPDDNLEKPLSKEHRALLISKLERKQEMTFDEIRNALGFLETVRFNLEGGRRTKLQGMVCDALMAQKKIIGPAWHGWPDDRKTAVVHLLATSTDDDETRARLLSECHLSEQEADCALGVDLPGGYINLSVLALEKLLPHLERGLILMGKDETNSAMHAAGYMRRDELQRRVFDTLPDPARVRDARIGDIPNPVVKRALVELRKVVNAIIREYGKPHAIHVELARDVRQGRKARDEYSKRIREIEMDRAAAADAIRSLQDEGISVRVTRDSILQYLLWKQQEHECIYCGEKISQAQLFGGDIDVDHILPYSRSLDDSQMNKVVCHRTCNADKRNQTPYEWLAASDPQRYERLSQHTLALVRRGAFPYRKYRRIVQKELDLDDFIARQLTATGYIARATHEYLQCLFEQDHHVLGLKGELTAELRRQWGLNDILRNDGPNLKSRDDHRHHAVDAIVIAMTNRSRLQRLSRIRRGGGMLQTGEVLDFPWETFRDDVIAAVNRINVSHRVERKVAGALHEATFYGPTGEPGVFVVRKAVEALSPNEVPLIRDTAIRGIVAQRLEAHGIEFGRGKNDVPPKKWQEALAGLAMPSGVPIKRVRVLRREQTIQPIRAGRPDQAFVKPGSTHHLALFEWEENGNRKRGAVFVTMLEAFNRVQRHEPIIQRTPPAGHPTIPPDARFLFSLSRGEMVWANWKGTSKLLIYKTASSTQGTICFIDHTDAKRSKDQTKFRANTNTLDARKVTVDPIGRIRWAND